jgi:hypothetical protein
MPNPPLGPTIPLQALGRETFANEPGSLVLIPPPSALILAPDRAAISTGTILYPQRLFSRFPHIHTENVV